jgi:hypothetical protein
MKRCPRFVGTSLIERAGNVLRDEGNFITGRRYNNALFLCHGWSFFIYDIDIRAKEIETRGDNSFVKSNLHTFRNSLLKYPSSHATILKY